MWKIIMQELRQATDDIYGEKSNFEFAIAPLEIFESGQDSDAQEEYNKFKRQYTEEFDSEIFGAAFGNWSLLSSWEQNREVRDFYTANTEILERIVNQHMEDQRMGTKLIERASCKGKDKRKKGKGSENTKEQEKVRMRSI